MKGSIEERSKTRRQGVAREIYIAGEGYCGIASGDDERRREGNLHIYLQRIWGIGGVDSIFARGKTDRDTSSTTILLEFSELQELAAGDHYVLIGGYGETGVTSRHYKNHYGAANLIEKLKQLADTVYSLKSYRIRINDMSLVEGGPLDINNDWDTPHQKHREGVSADISNQVLRSNGSLFPLTEDQLKRWSRLLLDIPNIGSEPGHYHLTIR